MTLPAAIALVFTSVLFWFWFECWEPFAALPAASNFIRIISGSPVGTSQNNTEKLKMNLLIGSEIATKARISSRSEAFQNPLKTLQDLLRILTENPPREFATIKSAAAAWAGYLGKPLDEILIESLFEKDTRKGFRPFLVGRCKENTIRKYVDHIRFLAARAMELSARQKDAVPAVWQEVVTEAAKRNCLAFALYFARIKAKPQLVSSKDTNALIKKLVDDGAYYKPTKGKAVSFWRLLDELGVNGEKPACVRKLPRFGCMFKALPFREKVQAMLDWRTDEYSPGRPDEDRMRPATAKVLRGTICTLFGYVSKEFPSMVITDVPDLYTKVIVESYIKCEMNERKVDGYSLRKRLAALCAAIRIYPHYHPTDPESGEVKPLDLAWSKTVLATLPKKKDKDKIKLRKSKSRVEHKLLRTIPAQMAAKRQLTKAGTIEFAISLRNQLLWAWLLVLPWRQRNIRECRIGEGNNPNLFKGPITSDFELQPWVKDEIEKARKNNKTAEFWQMRFSKDETKVGNSVEAVIPLNLIKLLEEYLENRHLLITGIDPGTLFVSDRGLAWTDNQVTDLVETLTLRWVNTVINPHRWRDLFAYAFLVEFPKDYLTLSKALWHTTIQETLETYGAEFGIANAVVATESWAANW